MILQASSPIIKDGNEYPFYTINLAISPKIQGSVVGGSVALRLTPYRVLENGDIDFCLDETKAVAYGDVLEAIAQGDSNLELVISSIMAKIQEFILAKGL